MNLMDAFGRGGTWRKNGAVRQVFLRPASQSCGRPISFAAGSDKLKPHRDKVKL